MTEPAAFVYSVTTTKRRRFIWCAWWTAAPERKPFRKPDAWAGARTEEEARRLAEKAAGRPLTPIEPTWARAWIRVQAGLPPWAVRGPKQPRPEPPPPPPREAPRRRPASVPAGTSPYAVLGVAPGAPASEIKRAFRRLALATHPDRGGDAAGFIRVKWAHDEALARTVDKARRVASPRRPC